MAVWAVIAGVYGLVLAVAAGLQPIRRRLLAGSAAFGYSLLAFGAGTLPPRLWTELVLPGALLLAGYWLSGFYFRDPQPRLERWLLELDRRAFRCLSLDRLLERSPRWVLELLELSYAAVYVVVTAGAILAAANGLAALTHYWSVVIGSELACYVMLPWLRSRPPRVLAAPGVMARRAPVLRRLNGAILDGASVQANTLPSGHVAGSLAAALAVWPFAPAVGGALAAAAVLIAIAAAAGRYHYVVDCVAGVSVALVVSAIV